MWEYTTPNKLPCIVLKTRRSMRAVHFHPEAHPVVLTAEVQDPSATSELPISLSETGPYSRIAKQQQQQHALSVSARRQIAARPPPSQELPIPSPQLLHGVSSQQASQASSGNVPSGHDNLRRVYIPTSAGPVQIPGSAGPAQISDMLFNAIAPRNPELWQGHVNNVGSRLEGQGRPARDASPEVAADIWSAGAHAAAGSTQDQPTQQPGLWYFDEHNRRRYGDSMAMQNTEDTASGASGGGPVNDGRPVPHTTGWVPPGR